MLVFLSIHHTVNLVIKELKALSIQSVMNKYKNNNTYIETALMRNLCPLSGS